MWICSECGWGTAWHKESFVAFDPSHDPERRQLELPFSASVRPIPKTKTDWRAEREDVLRRFAEELSKATGDGSKKRQAGQKPPWYQDDSHEKAIFSHLYKWKKSERFDPDSGAHPLVHAAWRCLAIALIETGNIPDETDS